MKAEFAPRRISKDRPKLEEYIPLAVPFIINVDPSAACNFQCKFCPTGDKKAVKDIPGRFHIMDMELFKKIINDISKFERPIKVLRLYKDGEPLLNRNFSEMITYAKQSGCCEVIDTTTNASLLTPEKSLRIIEAGLDRINISIYGVRSRQYSFFSGDAVDFDRLVYNIRYFYEHSRNKCHMFIKINGDIVSESDQQRFLKIFGDIADQIHIEHVMSCWPNFDVEGKGIKINPNVGIYGQSIKEVIVCPYIFYSFSINSSGQASACFLDWERKLLIGDVKEETVRGIWVGKKLRNLQLMMLSGKRRQHFICGNCDQLRRGEPDNIDAFAEELLNKIRLNIYGD